MLSRQYPYIGSPQFWYRANKWTLQHPYRWAAIWGAVAFFWVLVYFQRLGAAVVLGVVLTASGSWNFTRGFGRRNLERRIREYEAKHPPNSS